jgi:hypothetical protein
MNFVFGLVLGFLVGCLVMHLVHEYIDSMLPKEEEERWLGKGGQK